MELYSEDYEGFLSPVHHPYSFPRFVDLMNGLPGSIAVRTVGDSSVYQVRPRKNWPEEARTIGVWNCDGVTVMYEDHKYLTPDSRIVLGHVSVTLDGSDDAVGGVERKILDSIENAAKKVA